MHSRPRHAVIIGLAVALLAPVSVAAGVAGAASAHDYAVASTPADGSVLTELPAEFELTMNEDVLDLGGAGNGFALQIIGPDGMYYGDGCITIAGARMATASAVGPAGAYRMLWQIVSADGHPVSDEYDFTWAPATTPEPSTGSATAPVCGVDPPSPSPIAGTSPSGSPSAGREPSPTPASASIDSQLTPLWAGGVAVAAIIALVLILLERRRRRHRQ